jgi:hypothetical protein
MRKLLLALAVLAVAAVVFCSRGAPPPGDVEPGLAVVEGSLRVDRHEHVVVERGGVGRLRVALPPTDEPRPRPHVILARNAGEGRSHSLGTHAHELAQTLGVVEAKAAEVAHSQCGRTLGMCTRET